MKRTYNENIEFCKKAIINRENIYIVFDKRFKLDDIKVIMKFISKIDLIISQEQIRKLFGFVYNNIQHDGGNNVARIEYNDSGYGNTEWYKAHYNYKESNVIFYKDLLNVSTSKHVRQLKFESFKHFLNEKEIDYVELFKTIGIKLDRMVPTDYKVVFKDKRYR